MAKPDFSLHFGPTRIEVAASTDLAYDVGTFELKLNDEAGNPMVIPGKYVAVWKKQHDGQWKVEADIFNTDKLKLRRTKPTNSRYGISGRGEEIPHAHSNSQSRSRHQGLCACPHYLAGM